MSIIETVLITEELFMLYIWRVFPKKRIFFLAQNVLEKFKTENHVSLRSLIFEISYTKSVLITKKY